MMDYKSPCWNRKKGWSSVERICGRRGCWVEIGHKTGADADEMSWCVQCGGSGYYFSTKEECYAYLRGRRFLRRDDPRSKITSPAAALAYCRGRGLVNAPAWLNTEQRAWEHCVKYRLCEVTPDGV